MTDTQNAAQKPWIKSYPAGIRWDEKIETTTLLDLLAQSVKTHGDKTCLNFMGKKLSFNEVDQLSDRFAKNLQDQGIGKGSKVGLCLPNSPFYVIAYYGALKAGAAVVNFNPLYAEQEIKHQINDSGCDVMVAIKLPQVLPKIDKMLNGATGLKKVIVCDIADALPLGKRVLYTLSNKLAQLRGKAPAIKTVKDDNHIRFPDMLKDTGKPKPVSVTPDDVAVLQYTGGTTGLPKAVALTHANLTANIAQSALWFTGGGRSSENEKMLAILPFFHVFSMTVQMNLSIKLGAELIMLPNFDAGQALQTMEKEKPTIFAGVPTLYKALLDYDSGKVKNASRLAKVFNSFSKKRCARDFNLSSVNLWLSGGAGMPETTAQAWQKLTGKEPTEGYGLSETSPLVIANPVGGVKKAGSIGLPMPGTEVQIMKIDGAQEECPAGAEGEICLRGPQVMKEYWNQPAETAQVIDANRFLHSGDIGYIDNDGYVFIVDRLKDMINASGLKVFPRKVEEALLQHPAVSEAIVLGVKDDYRGENVKAYIVFKPGQTAAEADLKSFLKDKLAPYEMPKLFEYRDRLPKTVVGKPDKKALKKEEEQRAAQKPAAAAPKPAA